MLEKLWNEHRQHPVWAADVKCTGAVENVDPPDRLTEGIDIYFIHCNYVS